MCSNFEAIKREQADWVHQQFNCELPQESWHDDIYPTYQTPFIWREGHQIRCELAHFGLVPAWAQDKPRFGTKTYNARSETVAEKPSYRKAWKQRQFGLALMQSFYEPCYETGKAIRWQIKRADEKPIAVASLWERYIDQATGEICFSFSLLTINATNHPLMKRFHGPEDEKRSIVVLDDAVYLPWLAANPEQARSLLTLAPDGFLECEAAPRVASSKQSGIPDE
jgi:putative SOS response-associated peptidase YedK